jgi:hypothetical protein
MGVRGGLGVNAFRQLHLNIKSNLVPSPFCSVALAERDELCQCAPGEGKGADEAHRVRMGTSRHGAYRIASRGNFPLCAKPYSLRYGKVQYRSGCRGPGPHKKGCHAF